MAHALDHDFQGVHFSISIPIARALDKSFEVILAHEVDGAPLPPDHGYPLRLVIPGYIGVRNCKWVTKLEISDEEATSVMQRRDYKMIKETDWTKIDYDKYASINPNVQNSCITYPDNESHLASHQLVFDLKGFAMGNGEKGLRIEKV